MSEENKYNFSTAEFPLGARQNTDGTITVEQMLNEPTRISRYVTEKVAKDLLSPHFFSSTSVSGGTLIYNQLLGTESAITPKRTGVIEPGGEFPLIDNAEVAEKLTRVKKVGGKVAITDEAVKRNDSRFLNQELMRLANRMVVDLDADAVKALNDAMEAVGDKGLTHESKGWEAENKKTAANKTPAESIEADLAHLRMLTQKQDLGYNFNTLLISPEDYLQLTIAFGIGNEEAFLRQYGWKPVVTKNTVKGEAFLLAPQQVGVIGVESPISTETWREAVNQTSYSQTWATMAYAVTDPLALVKITNISPKAEVA